MSVLMGCGAPAPVATPDAPIVLPLPDVAEDLWQSRGDILEVEPYDDPPLEHRDSVLGRGWKAVYTSVSGLDGGMRPVSGAFFIPSGTPPEGGWPVISLAHGTTGIGHDCGPSRQRDLMGYAPMIEGLLEMKYAVALTDYEGLGDSGTHPYLEPRTAAFNTIDAVRALRNISPDVSARWVALGFSQGGHAVWATNELNSFYGNDLDLLGSVSLAPAADVTGLTNLVSSGSLTKGQRARFALVIVGLAQYNPNLDDHAFLGGSTEAYRRQMSRCLPTGAASENNPSSPILVPWRKVVGRVKEANDFKPASQEDAAQLAEVLRRAALPQRPLDKPMLVVTGGNDDVTLPKWIQTAVSRSCELGGQIEYLQIPDAIHEEMTWKPAKTVARWLAERLIGIQAPSNCPVQQK